MNWTDQAISDAIERQAAGQSASQIAAAPGTTKNAVIGKLHRACTKKRWTASEDEVLRRAAKEGLGWPYVAVTLLRTLAAVQKRALVLGLATPRAEYLAKARAVAPKPYTGPQFKEAFIALPDIAPATLVERTGCCFPVDGGKGEQLYCNAPVEGVGDTWRYCQHHKSIMHSPTNHPKSIRRINGRWLQKLGLWT